MISSANWCANMRVSASVALPAIDLPDHRRRGRIAHIVEPCLDREVVRRSR